MHASAELTSFEGKENYCKTSAGWRTNRVTRTNRNTFFLLMDYIYIFFYFKANFILFYLINYFEKLWM